MLALVLSPHLGLLLLSLAKVWSFSVLPEGLTLNHYAVVLTDSSRMIGNTLLYCTLAAGIDVVLGTAIAYLILRTRLPLRRSLDFMASAALAPQSSHCRPGRCVRSRRYAIAVPRTTSMPAASVQ